jgi:hypothetical protein
MGGISNFSSRLALRIAAFQLIQRRSRRLSVQLEVGVRTFFVMAATRVPPQPCCCRGFGCDVVALVVGA